VAWSVQLVGLPLPQHADLVAARAAGWLNDYRTAVDVFYDGHRRIEGLCLNGTLDGRHSEQPKSSVLVLPPRERFHVSQTGTEERVVNRRGLQSPPGLLAANAGCTYELLVQIGDAARAKVGIDAVPTLVARQPAIALRLPVARRERLTLYVARSTYRPLAASAVIDGQRITARLHLMHVDQRLLASFGLHSRRP
jgi:hypothetical protein